MTRFQMLAATAVAAVACVGLVACSPAAPKGDAAPAAAAPATVTQTSAPAASPRAFVEDLYGQYKANESFSPFTDQEKWFDPELIAAMKEDSDLANGEVGAVDGDPICSCQDASGMEAQVAGVEQTSPTTAVATVKLWAGTPDQREIKVDLVLVGGQWRVHDAIATGEAEGNHSFLTYVREANAEARKPH